MAINSTGNPVARSQSGAIPSDSTAAAAIDNGKATIAFSTPRKSHLGQSHHFPAVRLGGKRAVLRFRSHDIEAFINAHLTMHEGGV